MSLDISSLKVLVVDDFTSMRIVTMNYLSQMGFTQIDEAENGKEAFEKLKAGEYDLVLSDWNMPEMSGIDLLKTVRDDEKLKEILFIIITTESDKNHLMQAVKLKANNYIVKPFQYNKLAEKVNHVLEKL